MNASCNASELLSSWWIIWVTAVTQYDYSHAIKVKNYWLLLWVANIFGDYQEYLQNMDLPIYILLITTEV